MTTRTAAPKRTKRTAEKPQKSQDLSATYDEFKEFEGQVYTGARVGRHQKWYYDQGEWKERKVTPERWEFEYAVTKHRAGHAPEGSGVPEGTEYHWFIVAHQNVRKLDANNYSTAMQGVKYKLAHKRADKATWSASENAQRKHLIKILQGMIAELEQEGEAPPAEAIETGGDGGRGKTKARAGGATKRTPKEEA